MKAFWFAWWQHKAVSDAPIWYLPTASVGKVSRICFCLFVFCLKSIYALTMNELYIFSSICVTLFQVLKVLPMMTLYSSVCEIVLTALTVDQFIDAGVALYSVTRQILWPKQEFQLYFHTRCSYHTKTLYLNSVTHFQLLTKTCEPIYSDNIYEHSVYTY